MLRLPFASNETAALGWAKSSVARTLGAPLALLRKSQILENKYVRRVAFESLPPNAFVVSQCENEAFVVSTSDKVIGRYTYARRKPWDVDKLKAVCELLPAWHARTTLVDIGANIGTICISALKRRWFGKAVAVEPDPLNFALLMSNVYLNGLQNDIRAHNMALGACDCETLTLDRSSGNFGDRRIVSGEAARGSEVVEVASGAFDTVVGELAPDSALIWMDVQGFEGFVLSGAQAALGARHPLCVEVWPFGLKQSGSQGLFRDAILAAGYREFIRLDGAMRRTAMSPASFDALWASVGEGEDLYADVLFL